MGVRDDDDFSWGAKEIRKTLKPVDRMVNQWLVMMQIVMVKPSWLVLVTDGWWLVMVRRLLASGVPWQLRMVWDSPGHLEGLFATIICHNESLFLTSEGHPIQGGFAWQQEHHWHYF